jgi:UPF0716 protein FxsA
MTRKTMFLYLLILFTAVPIVELALLIRIGRVISVGPTIGLVVLTGMVGATLARHQGIRTLARIQTELAGGRMPTGPMVDGLLILVAGLLLITPGILTDGVGFALLIPPARRRIRRRLADSFARRVTIIPPGPFSPPGTAPRDDGRFIDVEATEVPPPGDERTE